MPPKRKLIPDGSDGSNETRAKKRRSIDGSKQTPAPIKKKQSIPDLLVSLVELLNLPDNQKRQNISNISAIIAELKEQRNSSLVDLFFPGNKNKLDELIEELNLYRNKVINSRYTKHKAENIVRTIAGLFYDAYMNIKSDLRMKKTQRQSQSKTGQLENRKTKMLNSLVSLYTTYFINMLIEEQVSANSMEVLESLKQINHPGYIQYFQNFKETFREQIIRKRLEDILKYMGEQKEQGKELSSVYRDVFNTYIKRSRSCKKLCNLLWNIAVCEKKSITPAEKLLLLNNIETLWNNWYISETDRMEERSERYVKYLKVLSAEIKKTEEEIKQLAEIKKTEEEIKQLDGSNSVGVGTQTQSVTIFFKSPDQNCRHVVDPSAVPPVDPSADCSAVPPEDPSANRSVVPPEDPPVDLYGGSFDIF